MSSFSLQDIYEYRLLKLRRHVERRVLSTRDQLRLRELEKLFETPESFGRALLHVKLPGIVQSSRGFEIITIQAIGGHEIVLAPAPSLACSEIACVALLEPASGRAYSFSFQAISSFSRPQAGTALRGALVGIPAMLAPDGDAVDGLATKPLIPSLQRALGRRANGRRRDSNPDLI
ncbi:MAG: hypothetical protein HY698_08675 [Deltaproteobacteria bacterium]|nr:hypothetical protein [Deltaproteobacteria bacterium]